MAVRPDGRAMTELGDRYRGSLLGLAAGDALGTTVEFSPPGTFEPVADIVGGGVFKLEPGEWTDDTSMALCLAESLIECRGFDTQDQLRRYVRWWKHGHLSSNGRCFDIGTTIRRALERFLRTGESWCGSAEPQSAGNGSLMRLAPVPLAFAEDPRGAVAHSGESSRTTHQAREAVDACRYLGALMVGALRGEPKEVFLSAHYTPVAGLWEETPLAPRIAAVSGGSFTRREPPAIRGTGYVVESLEAALWALHRSASLVVGALLAVNLGDDADTTGAVYGQVAGAIYGESGIPARWRARLAHRDQIISMADRLLELATARD